MATAQSKVLASELLKDLEQSGDMSPIRGTPLLKAVIRVAETLDLVFEDGYNASKKFDSFAEARAERGE